MEYSRLRDANPWWEDKRRIEQDIHLRKIDEQKLKWEYELIKEFKEGIYSVRGPRQVGKTTWIKQKIRELLKDNKPQRIFFYSCDDIKDFKELIELIELFLELNEEKERKYIFLDEIPYVIEWQRGIKHLYDSGKLSKCSVVLSGSHSIDIKRSIEQLPGRGDEGKRHYIMLPLTFFQYLETINFGLNLTSNFEKDIALMKLNFKEIDKEYKKYLLTGGFLKIINEFVLTGEISDPSYDVYLKWIIGDLAKWELKENFSKQIIKRTIESYMSELSWSSIKSGTDIDSHNTISKYVNAMDEMFVLNILYKMDFNKKSPDFPKSKKIYFSDPFIFSACYKWVHSTENSFQKYKSFLENNIDRVSEGVLYNHFINMNYRRTKSNIYNYKDKIFYWTDKNKTKEIDFIYNDAAFELKYQEKITSRDYKAISSFKKYYLISKKTFDKNTIPLPVFLILLERHRERFL